MINDQIYSVFCTFTQKTVEQNYFSTHLIRDKIKACFQQHMIDILATMNLSANVGCEAKSKACQSQNSSTILF